MKKILFSVLVCLVSFQFNQVSAVEKGDFVIQPNLNLGNYGIAKGINGGMAFGVTANFDYAVHDYVSLGGFIGFNTVSARYSNSYNYGRMAFGARGIFHFWQLIDDKVSKDLKSDKVDFYLPLHLGYNIYTGNGSGGDFNMGLAIGIRYYFNDRIGLAFETGGTELSFAKLGVAIKM